MADCVMLPYVLASKMCLLNVYDTPVNEPESCFKWAVITSMHSTQESFGDISWKDFAAHRHALDFSCIKGGERRVALSDIPVFEKKNKLSVNVLGYETCFIPLYVSENAKHKNWPRVNLLMFESDGLEGPLVHYCAIKDMSRLVGSQIYSGNRKHFFCFRCLVSFQTKDNLSDHERHCQLFAPARTVFPKVENKWVRFKNFKNQLPVSFMIVAEFQCYVQKITDLNEPTEGPVVRERKFEPCAWTYMRVSANDAFPSAPVMYRGKDPKDTMQRFLMAMEEEERYVFNILHNKKVPIVLEETGLANLAQTTDICHICEDTFLPGETKVVDHSHTTGVVRGFAHQSCNLNFKEASFLPILIENLGTNEGRLIMSAIGHYGSSNVSVIAQNGDNFISIKVNRCRYLDTRRFLDCSLGSLVEDTAASRGLDGFRYVRKYVQPDSTDLFMKELHFCHEHFDGPERLHERECPGEKGFYDVTTDKGIDSESYKVVLELWKKMECETLENFLETYLMGRVLQLADIIINLRESLLFDLKLDPIHYFSISGFAWDSALKWSKVDLELITSSEMYLFVESSMRGGLASIGSPRFARANNDTMPEGEFDPTKPLSYMHYFDFNGLYASVMRDFALPTHGYRWLTEEEKEKVNLQDIDDECSELGYLIECDLEYPSELHHEHDSFPLAPEYTDVIEEEMSAYTKDMAKSMGIDIGNCGKKLLTTLKPKTKYVVHYVTLKLYLQLGMKMTEVHRVLQFKQSKWLSDYVSMLTEKRRLTLSSVNGKLYKTIACAVYGKSLQNPRNYCQIKVCQNAEQLQSLVCKPSFGNIRVSAEDSELCLVEMTPTKVLLNSCILLGSSILELSKARVYDFFYKQLFRMFPTKLGWRTDLLMCDTDGLLVRVTGNGKVNDTLQQNSHLFDFSNLPETHPLRNDKNRKVPGKIKLELGSRVCYEFVGLSAKCYSILTDSNSKIACKGVKNSSALRHSQYKSCLFDSITHKGQHRGVRSYNLQLYQTSVRKRQLNPFDPKRFYVNKLLSHSFGHWKIAEVTELPVRNLVAEFPDEGGDDVIVISDDEKDQTHQGSTILDSSYDVPVMRQLYNGTDCWHINQLEEDTCDACSSKTAAASGLQ